MNANILPLPHSSLSPENITIPIVVEQTPQGERSYDLPSRLMNSRIIMVDTGFDDHMAHVIKMQLLWLDSQDSSPITLYINSPGGSVHAGIGIADVIDNMRSPVRTVVMGMAASMGCYMQSTMGTPGMRLAGKRAQIMAHMVSSGTQGTVKDQQISLQHSLNLNTLLMSEIADAVGQDYETFLKDCDRDMWLNAEEALNYGTKGFIDGIYLGEQNEKGQLLVKRRNGVEEWV